ncbi:MAG: GTPase [Candidatus Micrarchaeia archaeon]
MAEKSEFLEEKLESLKEEYSKTKYNKATNKHLGILRRKIAEVRKELIESSKGKKGKGFFVKKGGDATVALVGFPSTGKSTLINVLTGTSSKTAQHAFTTLEIIPGTLVHRGAHIQVFDMPGIIEGASSGLGGGRSVISALRTADLVVFVIDVLNPEALGILLNELSSARVYANKQKPEVKIEKMPINCGIVIEKNSSSLPDRYVAEILRGFNIFNAHVKIESEIDADSLIAIVSGRAFYVKAIAALNKIDLTPDYRKIAESISKKYGISVIPISASSNLNIDALKDAIYNSIGIITIYMKPKGGNEEPVIMRRGATVRDAALKVHTELQNELKCAYVSGPSAKFSNQKVGANHVLMDGDTVTFIK